MRLSSLAAVAIGLALSTVGCVRWPGQIKNPEYVPLTEEQQDSISRMMQALYWNLEGAQRGRLDDFDLVIERQPKQSVTSTRDAIVISADALAAFLSNPRSGGTWSGEWYPALAFTVAHEMGHWVFPEDETPLEIPKKELLADRFAFQLTEKTGNPSDPWHLLDSLDKTFQSAKAEFDSALADYRAFNALPKTDGRQPPRTAERELVRRLESAALRTAEVCLLNTELRLRVRFVLLDEHLRFADFTRSPEKKQEEVARAADLRQRLEQEAGAIDECVELSRMIQPTDEPQRLLQAANIERGRLMQSEARARLKDKPLRADDELLLSQEERWRNSALVRPSASIAPAVMLWPTRNDGLSSRLGWLVGVGATQHGANFLSGGGIGATFGRFSANLPPDLRNEEPVAPPSPVDIRVFRVGLRFVYGKPLVGPLMFDGGFELGYRRESYDYADVAADFTDAGMMFTGQGQLAARLAPWLHAGIGLQASLLFLGDLYHLDFAAPFTLALYL